jgi:hypothetical protein
VIDDGIKVFVGPINIVAGLRQQGNNNITVLSVGWDSFDNLSRFEEVYCNQRKVETEDSAGHGIEAEARYLVLCCICFNNIPSKERLALPAGACSTRSFSGAAIREGSIVQFSFSYI